MYMPVWQVPTQLLTLAWHFRVARILSVYSRVMILIPLSILSRS